MDGEEEGNALIEELLREVYRKCYYSKVKDDIGYWSDSSFYIRHDNVVVITDNDKTEGIVISALKDKEYFDKTVRKLSRLENAENLLRMLIRYC